MVSTFACFINNKSIQSKIKDHLMINYYSQQCTLFELIRKTNSNIRFL